MPRALVLLHGSNGSGETLKPLADALLPFGPVHTPDLVGHGGRPVPARFSIEEWAADILAFLDSKEIDRAFLAGYSFGGYLALYIARHFPERVRGVCTLATKYVYDENTIRHFTHLLDIERLTRPGNPRPEQLTRTHFPQDWTAITNNNRRFFQELGRRHALSDEDFRAISVPVLVLSGDRDQLVPQAETLALAKLLPRSRVGIFQGCAHPLSEVPIQMVADAMGKWLAYAQAQAY